MYKVLDKYRIEIEIDPYIPKTSRGFPPTVPLHEIVNAILFKPKTGVQWANLPVTPLFGKIALSWQSVYHHYRKWCKGGVWKHCWTKMLYRHRASFDLSSVDLDGGHTPALTGGEGVAYRGRKKGKTTNSPYMTDRQGLPFTPQPTISQALILAADKPIFCGVGGGITNGDRSVELAVHADFQGALGVVLNKPTPNDIIRRLKEKIDIPVTITLVSEKDDIKGRIDAGIDIFNVSGAEKTSAIIKRIRDVDDEVAIIATGGKTIETIYMAIVAGANAISYTPPSTGQLFKDTMERYRNE